MAITKYLQPNAIENRLALEYQVKSASLQARREKKQKAILYWGILPCVLCPPLLPVPLALYFFAGRSESVSLDPIQLAGCAGEHKTLAMLKHLDDRYTIFNQVKLPYDKSSTGYREADFIVHGPNGIFVVESKEYSGNLCGTEYVEQWTSVKESASGEIYSKAVTNPVRQVKHYSKLIADALKEKGVESWVEGVVSLTRNNNMDEVDTTNVAVLPVSRLTNYIERFVKRRPHPNSLNALLELAQTERKATPLEFKNVPAPKEPIMSKDDLLFKNVMKIFTVIGVLGVGLPLLYFVAPGLVTSLLMLGAIVGFFYLFIKFVTIAAGTSHGPSNSRPDILKNSSYTNYPSGNVYAPGSSIKGTFD